MAETRHLLHAPISEALIDLRVALPPDSIDKLKGLTEKLKDRYPKRLSLQHGQFKFQFGDEPNAEQIVSGIHGYLCSSNDDQRKVQFRGDGFTFNKLKPYETWETMRDEARELWGMYVEAIGGELTVQRVALRYVNHLEVPLGTPLSSFLTAPPTLPESLPQGVFEYLYRVVLQDNDLKALAIITQHLPPSSPEQGPTQKLLFDIDVFRDNANLNKDDVWDLLEEFRKFKNKIFFQSITEKTVEICNYDSNNGS